MEESDILAVGPDQTNDARVVDMGDISADCPCDLSMVAEILKHSDILSEDSNEHA
jgi:hypothetical protein